jgi:hypothetical protein
MPGEKKPRCPKGEKRDKKTNECVKKVKKTTPKKRVITNFANHNIRRNALPKHKAVKKNNNTRKKPVPKKKANSNASEKRNTTKKSNRMSIPLLSKMEDSSRYKNYIEDLLFRLKNAHTDTSYLPNGHIYVYNNLDELLHILNKDIKQITTTQEAGNYAFTSVEIREDVIPQLNKYKIYFKHIANEKGHVDTDLISELME